MTLYGPQPLAQVLQDFQLTEATAARYAAVSRPTLGALLDGERAPTARMIQGLVELTGLPPEELFTAEALDGTAPPPRPGRARTQVGLTNAEVAQLRRAVGLNPDGRPR